LCRRSQCSGLQPIIAGAVPRSESRCRWCCSTAPRRVSRLGSLVRRRDLGQGRWTVGVSAPGHRPGRAGHRRVGHRDAGPGGHPAILHRTLEYGPSPSEVTTDHAAAYPRVLDELLPAACHVTEQYGNNPLEFDHGLLKSRLRAMRGLKQLRCAQVITAGRAFIQNIRRRHYELAAEETVSRSWLPSTRWSGRSNQPRSELLDCSYCAMQQPPSNSTAIRQTPTLVGPNPNHVVALATVPSSRCLFNGAIECRLTRSELAKPRLPTEVSTPATSRSKRSTTGSKERGWPPRTRRQLN